ncbi:efflux transporter periplasmic adaptor subunit [Vibrio genomosp. F10 str. ZF-129]|uniref:Efflux transporter periplasmic adaptor subunit n=1 Tax=Vibrio genomosp. F10 str. ZF-129 TaxID=1187848 RepID=A0A1E5BEI5_9VIBR|nr:efflux RND transporter periplasmic adaptor subunit [Vibrio genomosp. F10]OEE33927.1 efflux transporter periplasmic adaptor subunit [Vibrio genomosp. F10 str. ZF-129]
MMKQWKSVSLFAFSIVLAGCKEDVVKTEMVPLNVRVADLSISEARESLYFPAVANAAERSHLSFRVSGEISQLSVKEGDRVKKGQLIAKLDPTDYQLDVDNAQARFTVVNNQFNRSKPLVNKGLLAKSQFDEIAAQRQIALAELELAKLRLSFTQLKAPVDGIISRVNTDQFENVQVGQYIVNIHSVETVEILIQLPDRLHVNSPTHQAVDTIQTIVRVPSGNEYEASVKEFTTEPDPATGTFTATLSMPMPESEYILDGMAVEVTATGESLGHSISVGAYVPVEAIFNGDGDGLERDNKYVWVLQSDNTVTKRKVTLGKASQNSFKVLDGLDTTNVVVVAGLSKLREGMKVNVISEVAFNE